MQATTVGQAVAGFGVSVLSFVTIWAAPDLEPGEIRRPEDVAKSALSYFSVSALVIAASIAGYLVLQRLTFWQHYTRAPGMSGSALFPVVQPSFGSILSTTQTTHVGPALTLTLAH
jgi:hypothetical protein